MSNDSFQFDSKPPEFNLLDNPLHLPNLYSRTSPEKGNYQTALSLHTLRLGEKADRSTTELVSPDNAMARIFEENANGIVRIKVSEADGTAFGTGFFVTDEGRVATDAHVVKGAKSISVELADGRSYSAHVVADKQKTTNDLALLDIDAKENVAKSGFHALKLAESSSSLKSGDPLFALGHPQGWKQTFVSPGSFNEFQTSPVYGFNPQLLNINAYVHVEHGNSGGPLFNNKGEVVGVTRTIFNSDSSAGNFLHSLDAELPLQSNFTKVEELQSLLGRKQPSEISNYFIPKELNWRPDTTSQGAEFVASAMGAGWHMLKTSPGRGGFVRGIALPGLAGLQLYESDYPFFKAAMENGTMAEKINGGINVTADAMIIAGAGMMIHPRLVPIAGLMQLGGTGIKFANELLAERKYD